MSGFGPVGSFPVGAISSGLSGTYYGPGLANISFDGHSLSISGASPIAVRYVVRESLTAPPAANILPYLVVREILMSTLVPVTGGGFVSILW